jgi:hypothetical protein
MGYADDGDPTNEGSTVKTIKHIAPLFAAATIGAIGLAPGASAASSPTPVAHSIAAPSCAPQAPYSAGVGPLLLRGTDPYIPYFPGMFSLVS